MGVSMDPCASSEGVLVSLILAVKLDGRTGIQS